MGFQPEPFAQRLCSIPLHVYVSNHTHQLTNFSSWLATTCLDKEKIYSTRIRGPTAERLVSTLFMH